MFHHVRYVHKCYEKKKKMNSKAKCFFVTRVEVAHCRGFGCSYGQERKIAAINGI